MKTQHEIIIDAPRDDVWEAFSKASEVAVIDEVTEQRKPVFVAGTAPVKGGRAVIVGHFEEHADDATKITIYANRFFRGLAKLTSAMRGEALRKDIDDKLERLKLAVESARS